jgi:hypothetical protein
VLRTHVHRLRETRQRAFQSEKPYPPSSDAAVLSSSRTPMVTSLLRARYVMSGTLMLIAASSQPELCLSPAAGVPPGAVGWPAAARPRHCVSLTVSLSRGRRSTRGCWVACCCSTPSLCLSHCVSLPRQALHPGLLGGLLLLDPVLMPSRHYAMAPPPPPPRSGVC